MLRLPYLPIFRSVLFTIIAVSLTVPLSAQVEADLLTQERILSYDSSILISRDRSVEVTETIEVNALGDQIKRGIYRDFPTVYSGPYFTRVVVPFDILEVKKNGVPEPYHTEALSDGVRVYVGSESTFLQPGQYTYTFRYSTKGQLGFFDEHDEFYWNVTGNFWSFPIDKAAATVKLPPEIDPAEVRHEAYTGPVGSTGQDFSSKLIPESSQVHFETTRLLGSFEGLTIVVSFPKGVILEPTRKDQWNAFLNSNQIIPAAGIGLAAILLYFLIAWFLVGRDPEKGTIVALYEPPMNMSPAAMRYVREMGYDGKCFAAALLNMAVKGVLEIKDNEGTYTIINKRADRRNLSPGEKKIAKHLLKSGQIKIKNKNHSTIKKAIRGLKLSLAAEYEGKHFYRNRLWLIPGALLSIGTVIGAALFAAGDTFPVALFLVLWLSFWSIGTYALGNQVLNAWRSAFFGGGSGLTKGLRFGGAFFITLFSLPFFLGEIVGLGFLAYETTLLIVPLLLAIAGINYLFYQLIKRPTESGRQIMDQIEGFRTFLAATEGDRLNVLTSLNPTTELFEKYLPHALALGVENEWAEQFSEVFAAAETPEGRPGYSPGWYHGASFSSSSLGSFSSGLGSSLSSAVSSSSHAPGSRSGGGGGGFSGGGGGGGGGGGW